MDSFVDVFGRRVALADEVKQIILSKHPEVARFADRIAITLRDPALIKKSKISEKSRLYYRFFEDVLDGKFMVVVVKSTDQNYVSTVYVTDKVKEGEVLWQKN